MHCRRSGHSQREEAISAMHGRSEHLPSASQVQMHADCREQMPEMLLHAVMGATTALHASSLLGGCHLRCRFA